MITIVHSTLGLAHTIVATLALIFGTLVLLRPKGTTFHRKIGYGYLVSMVLVNLSAFGIFHLFGRFGIFHVLAIVSLVNLTLGMIPIFRRSPQSIAYHMYWMYYSVLGLYAAFISEIAVRVVPAIGMTWNVFFAIVGIGSTLVFVIGTLIIRRKAARWLKLGLFGILLLMISTQASSQSRMIDLSIRNTQLGSDYSIEGSLGWTSASGHFQVRTDIGHSFVSHFEPHPEQGFINAWNGYQTVRLALMGRGFLGEFIRIYGGGGPVLGIIGNVSTQAVSIGAYGFYGFGFAHGSSETFVEIGGVGGIGVGDKLYSRPTLGSGMFLSVGYRVYLLNRN
jgi:uncharacterized membrane protein